MAALNGAGAKVALYARVSTDEQTTGQQLEVLRALAKERELQVVGEYVETISGRKGKGKRPERDRLVKDARRRRFNVVLIWSLDRLGRNMVDVLQVLKDLEDAEVNVSSASEREAWLDDAAAAPLQRQLLVAVLTWIAEYQLQNLREDTRRGMDAARRQGKRIGRPPVSERGATPTRAAYLYELNRRDRVRGAVRRTAHQLGVSRRSLHRLLAAARIAQDGPGSARTPSARA